MLVGKTIPVISNCQALPIANALARYCPDLDFSSFGVHLLGGSPDEGKINDFISSAADSAVIITILSVVE
jgi:hypothetical protein